MQYPLDYTDLLRTPYYASIDNVKVKLKTKCNINKKYPKLKLESLPYTQLNMSWYLGQECRNLFLFFLFQECLFSVIVAHVSDMAPVAM